MSESGPPVFQPPNTANRNAESQSQSQAAMATLFQRVEQALRVLKQLNPVAAAKITQAIQQKKIEMDDKMVLIIQDQINKEIANRREGGQGMPQPSGLGFQQNGQPSHLLQANRQQQQGQQGTLDPNVVQHMLRMHQQRAAQSGMQNAQQQQHQGPSGEGHDRQNQAQGLGLGPPPNQLHQGISQAPGLARQPSTSGGPNQGAMNLGGPIDPEKLLAMLPPRALAPGGAPGGTQSQLTQEQLSALNRIRSQRSNSMQGQQAQTQPGGQPPPNSNLPAGLANLVQSRSQSGQPPALRLPDGSSASAGGNSGQSTGMAQSTVAHQLSQMPESFRQFVYIQQKAKKIKNDLGLCEAQRGRIRDVLSGKVVVDGRDLSNPDERAKLEQEEQKFTHVLERLKSDYQQCESGFRELQTKGVNQQTFSRLISTLTSRAAANPTAGPSTSAAGQGPPSNDDEAKRRAALSRINQHSSSLGLDAGRYVGGMPSQQQQKPDEQQGAEQSQSGGRKRKSPENEGSDGQEGGTKRPKTSSETQPSNPSTGSAQPSMPKLLDPTTTILPRHSATPTSANTGSAGAPAEALGRPLAPEDAPLARPTINGGLVDPPVLALPAWVKHPLGGQTLTGLSGVTRPGQGPAKVRGGTGATDTNANVERPPTGIGSELRGDKNKVVVRKKLEELMSEVAPGQSLSEEVAEFIYEYTDEFIESVTHGACQLAKHRKSDRLEVKDLQLYLDKNWNIRTPGFSSDEIRPSIHGGKRVTPAPGYSARLNAVRESIRKGK